MGYFHIFWTFFFNDIYSIIIVGRIEAVMVSCPPLVAWEYNHIPQEGSEEERLMKILKNPIDWCK